jgi:hydroxymethylpyrimidine pyrophosphatase-like HAD family hydrolase
MRRLGRVGCRVLLVTGRSSGWAAALCRYLPGVSGVVAENGAVFLEGGTGSDVPLLLDREGDANAAARIEACLTEVLNFYPEAVLGSDNFSRLTDRTIEVASNIDPDEIGRIARRFDLRHTYSSVHHHLSVSSLDKAAGLALALEHQHSSVVDMRREVVTVGDSFNDASLFDRETFAVTVGVRGVLRYLDVLGDRFPEYVTMADEGHGFNELCKQILRVAAENR